MDATDVFVRFRVVLDGGNLCLVERYENEDEDKDKMWDRNIGRVDGWRGKFVGCLL